MAKNLKKFIVPVIVLALLIGVMSVTVLASSDNGEPMPEPGSSLPTSPREDPDVTIEVLPDNNTDEETQEAPPYFPEFDFPVIPPVIEEPIVEIEEPEIPPVEEPEVPLVEEPVIDEPIEEIQDEDVPLADVPYTGSMSILWVVLSGMSAAALVLPFNKRKH